MEGKLQQLRGKLIRKAKKLVQEKYSEEDVHIIRGVALLQDLDASFNLLAENCIEWYSAHFPELHRFVRDNEKYLQLVSTLGERAAFTEKSVEKVLGEKARAKEIVKAAGSSMGSAVGKEALGEVKRLAVNALALRAGRKELEKFVEKEMKARAGNLSAVAGAILGARLFGAASGLKQLALMPSSTIQLLGAEKALFRHLRNKRIKGPKHGILYQHPLVRKVPAKHKGKVARSVAAKIAIAARADFFGSKGKVGEKLAKELEQRVKLLG